MIIPLARKAKGMKETLYLGSPSLSSGSQQVQKGRLATPRRPHDADHLTRVEVDRDAFKNLFDDSPVQCFLHFFRGCLCRHSAQCLCCKEKSLDLEITKTGTCHVKHQKQICGFIIIFTTSKEHRDLKSGSAPLYHLFVE